MKLYLHSPICLHGVHKDNFNIYVLQQGMKYVIAILKLAGSGLFTYVRVVVDNDVDGRRILRWTCRKWEGLVGTGWSWLRIGTGGGHL